MVPLACDDQHFMSSDNSCQLSTNYSLTHHCTGEKPSEINHKPGAKGQPRNREVSVPQSCCSHNKIQNCFPSAKSKVTHSQDFCKRATQSSSFHFKCPATKSPDFHRRSSSSPDCKVINSPLSHPKTKATTSSPKLKKTSSSLASNQTSLSSRLPFPKPQNTSPNPDLCWKSPSLGSNLRVSSSSLSLVQPHETPSLNTIWTAPSFISTQRASNSSLLQSTSEKFTSMDCFWTSLLKSNRRSNQRSPSHNKLQRNVYLSTSPPPKLSPMAQSSSSYDFRSQRMLSSNAHVLRLPMSHLQSKKLVLLPHTSNQSQSLPLFKTKSKMPLRLDCHFRAHSSPDCHSKLQPTTSPNVKHRARRPPPFHHGPKPKISDQSLSSPKPYIRNRAASPVVSRFQSKSNFEFNTKLESDKETPWMLDYSHPCIVKGGTIPLDVLNKIVNSISKDTIQKDLSRQILFRRMRGRPNPHPGPRLSSTYAVCLDCASYIQSQCRHLKGKKDPRGATLFVIPTPEASAEGKIEVKILLILSLPEKTSSSPCFPLPMKENQPDEDPEDNLEELQKIRQFFPASECNIIQGLKEQKGCFPMSSGNKDTSQQPQAIDWLLYVKRSNNYPPQSQLLSPPSSSSSSSSSYPSASSSSSSSSSSSIFSSPPAPVKDSLYPPLSDNVLPKVLSYHRLPPGVSWLEFICSKDYQLLSGKPKKGQSPSSKRKRGRNPTTKKGAARVSSKLLQYFQTKFQHREAS